jgi:RNA polymerase sigma-70 factor (ECF subfamily)
MHLLRGERPGRYTVTFAQLAVYEEAVAADLSYELAIPLAAPDREAALVARALRGDHESYAALVRPHENVAFRVATAITGRPADAEEALQNGFVKAFRSLHRFRAGEPFRPWLLRIVVNEAHNVRRSEQRHARLGVRAAHVYEPAVAGADEPVLAREEIEGVLAALARLSDADRLAVALRYFADLPDAAAARMVGTSPEAYRVRLVRARKRLQSLLEEPDA